VGFFFLLKKVSRHADQAMDKSHNVLSFLVDRFASYR
jgi:hypothetical protein